MALVLVVAPTAATAHLVSTPGDPRPARAVVLAAGVAAVAALLLRWLAWMPVVVLGYVWLQVRSQELPTTWLSAGLAVGSLAAGSVIYVLAHARVDRWRARRTPDAS